MRGFSFAERRRDAGRQYYHPPHILAPRAGDRGAATVRNLTLASQPPGARRSAPPLYYPERAALHAEVAAVLDPRPKIKASTCLEPCAPGASAVIGAPAQTFEGAQEFIYAAADWVERGAKASNPVKERASEVSEFFRQQMGFIERRAQKQAAASFRAAGSKYTEAFAKEMVEIKRNALLAVEKVDVPMTWFGLGSNDTKLALRDLERQEKRLIRTAEYGAAKQAKDLRGIANKVIKIPAGSTLLNKWATRFTYLTVAVDVGPAFLKVVTAKDDKEREAASTTFVGELANIGAGYVAGEAALGIVLLLGPAGWVTMGVGLLASTAAGIWAGNYVKEKIDPGKPQN
jgi:hypothetical protein